MRRRPDLRLLLSVLDGQDVATAAAGAMIGYPAAEKRLTAVLETLAASLGRGIVEKRLHRHRPDRVVPTAPPARPRPAAAAVIDAVAVEVAAPVVPLALPAPLAVPLARAKAGKPERQISAAPAPTARERSPVPQFEGFARLGGPESDPITTPRPRADPDRALIDAAIAAGKVTMLAPGHAAGLTQIEGQLYAAPPPLPEGGWQALNEIKKKNAIQAHHRAKAATS